MTQKTKYPKEYKLHKNSNGTWSVRFKRAKGVNAWMGTLPTRALARIWCRHLNYLDGGILNV